MNRSEALPRYAWLNRRTPLRARSALRRSVPLRRSRLEAKPVRPAVPVDVRAVLEKRSGAVCELLACEGCLWSATDVHHRVTTKSGGRCGEVRDGHDRLANLLHGCRPCHEAVHQMGTRAFVAGWRVREGFDPAHIPVWYRGGGERWLDDLGGVHEDEEAGA